MCRSQCTGSPTDAACDTTGSAPSRLGVFVRTRAFGGSALGLDGPRATRRRRQLLVATRSQERGTDVRDMGDGVIIECFGSALSSRVLAPRPASSADESTGPAVGIPTPTQPTWWTDQAHPLDGVALLHSTPWRLDPSSGVVLTYICCPDPRPDADGELIAAAQTRTGTPTATPRDPTTHTPTSPTSSTTATTTLPGSTTTTAASPHTHTIAPKSGSDHAPRRPTNHPHAHASRTRIQT